MNQKIPYIAQAGKDISAASMRLKQADRKELIIHAAWRLVATGGLAAVTIRSIAKEIASTTGIVVHYFATKEEVVEEMIDRLYSRLRATYNLALKNASAEDRLEKMLLATLPTKPKTAFGWKLSVALQGEVLRSKRIASLHNVHYQQFESDVCAELRRLQDAGKLSGDADLKMICSQLLVAIDGIGTQFVLRPAVMTPRVQRFLLQQQLSSIRTLV